MRPEPRPSIHMGKQLVWVYNLSGVEFLGVFKAGQTVLASLMESQIWRQLASSVGGGFRKGTMASSHLDARHFSSSLYVTPLVPFKLPPWCWSSEGVGLSR